MIEESLNSKTPIGLTTPSNKAGSNNGKFLKRKSKNITPKPESKKFNYYSDNFQENKTIKKPQQKPVIENITKKIFDNDVGNNEEEKNTIEINEKLKELENEIKILKQEQAEVKKQKSNYKSLFKQLQKEVERFNKQKKQEIVELKNKKEVQSKRIYQKLQQSKNSTQNEVQSLRKENKKLQNELITRDKKREVALGKLRKDYEELLNKNSQLENKLKELSERELRQVKPANNKSPLIEGSSVAGVNSIIRTDRDAENTKSNNLIKENGKIAKIEHIPTKKHNPKNNEIGKGSNLPKNREIKFMQVTKSTPHDKPDNKIKIQQQNKSLMKPNNSSRNQVKIHTKTETIKNSRIRNNTKPIENKKLNKSTNKSTDLLIKKDVRNINKEECKTIRIASQKEIKKEHIENFQDDEEFDMIFPSKYHSINSNKIPSKVTTNNGKVTKTFNNGKTETILPNGVKRESFPDGYTIVHFKNKDIKQTYPNGKTVYYFAKDKVTQTSFLDGLQIFKFPTGQLEKHHTDGTKEIL